MSTPTSDNDEAHERFLADLESAEGHELDELVEAYRDDLADRRILRESLADGR